MNDVAPDNELDQVVYVQDDAGNILQGPASELESAREAGYHEIAPEAVRDAQVEHEYGGPAGALGAASASALDIPTFGMGTGALGELSGDEDLKEFIQGSQAAHPWVTALGGVAAAIPMALATGGESLAGEAPLMERIVGGVARGALEGGAYGAGSQLSEDALGNTDTTAEKLIAAVGHGALIGGGVGGVFEGILGAGKSAFDGLRLRDRDVEALAERQFGHAAEGIGDAFRTSKAVDLYAAGASRLAGVDEGAIRSQLRSGSEGKALRALLHDDGEEFQAAAAREIREAGDEMLAANKLVTAEASGDLKASYVRRAVQTGNEQEVAGYALKTIDEVLDGAQATLDAGGGYTKAIEHASTSAYRAKAAIEDAVASGNKESNAKAFIALDNMKRDLQKLTRNSYQALQRIADPIDQRAARVTTEWLDRSAQKLRDGLENETLWGKAGADQRAINAAWTKQLDASKRFHASLTTEIGRDPSNPYLQMRGIDPGKASTYVRSIVNPDRDLTHQAVRDYIDSTKELSGAIQRSYDLPPHALEEAGRLSRAASRFNSAITDSEKALTFINQHRELRKGAHGGHLAHLGALIGGPAGAGLGFVGDMLSNPARQVQRLAALERLQDKVTRRISGVTEAALGRRGRIGTPPTLEHTPTRASFEASAKTVHDLAQNPAKMNSYLSASLGAMSTAAPKVATAIAMKSQQMVAFLASKLPPGMFVQEGTINPKWSKPTYSDSAMHEWQQYAAALHDPIGTVAHGLKTGTLTSRETGAIKQFYPRIYGEIVQDISKQLAEMEDPPAREQRLTLASLFEIPTDVDLEPGFASEVQGMYATPPPKEDGAQGGPRNKAMNLDVAPHFKTPAQEVGDEEK